MKIQDLEGKKFYHYSNPKLVGVLGKSIEGRCSIYNKKGIETNWYGENDILYFVEMGIMIFID